MRTVVLVPFRSDGAERDRDWRYACDWWARLGWPVLTGDTASGSFERSGARNVAARFASDLYRWDVALFCDADVVLASKRQAREAVKIAREEGAYTVAYSRLRYLSERGVAQLAGGENPLRCEFEYPSVGLTWECCFAIRRDIWDRVGGFDERFRGYGGQVAAFYYAASTFGGRARIEGDAFHMAHPLVDRSREPNFKANCLLAERYRAAVDDPEAMQMILDERMAVRA